jgi:hypothetical protein
MREEVGRREETGKQEKKRGQGYTEKEDRNVISEEGNFVGDNERG